MEPDDAFAPRLDASELRAGVPAGSVIGREILVFEETGSTNDLARRAGDDGLAEGLVIFAESQRAGRGTQGRRWMSPPRQGLWFSVLLRPVSVDPERWPELTFCAALAVAETAEQFTSRDARIKWPNDVLVAERKVSGILLECYRQQPPGFVVMGIGVNVGQRMEDFAPELRARAGSLTMAAKHHAPIPRHLVAMTLIRKLNQHYWEWPDNHDDVMEGCSRRGCSSE